MRFPYILSSIFLSWLISFFNLSPVGAMEWKLQTIKTAQPVEKIVQVGKKTVLIKAGTQWYRADWCQAELCLRPAKTLRTPNPPKGGMTDGGMAVHKSPGLVSAWYSDATRRYSHGILGDKIEGGSLIAKDHKGKSYSYRLAESSVFEDLTPRLIDLDGDGQAEIITIRSFLNSGGSVNVFGLRKGKLKLLATTPPIGQTYRWLNIAGTGDFNGDGLTDLAIVVTPHIGGTLEIWSFSDEKLIKVASKFGFSNHFIGSRNLNLSAVGDVNGDGTPDLAVPDASRHNLRIMSFNGQVLAELASIGLPGAVVEDIGMLLHSANLPPTYLLGLADGSLVSVSYR